MIPNTFSQIKKLAIDPQKPLLVFDADEVLVLFATHFVKYLNKFGWSLNLKGYRLDDAITHIEDGHVANKITYQKLINEFIRDETLNQPEATGASETLRRFKHRAEIIILTNVPISSYYDRIENLGKLGMEYPIISNVGPKGPALEKLEKLTDNICIFIDDNPHQIGSAAKYTPEIYRFHFTACSLVKTTMPHAEGATHRPKDWKEVGSLINHLIT
jgi:hypothetical protein